MALTAAQRKIANSLSRQARMMGRPAMLDRIEAGANERFGEPRIGQLLVQFAEKGSEVARHLVDGFREERFASALILSRTLLEDAARICWIAVPSTDAQRRDRALAAIAQGYRAIQAKGYAIPPDAKQILAEVDKRRLGKPPEFKDALVQLDKHEGKIGGTKHWQTHYGHFAFTSLFVHPGLYGPRGSTGKPILVVGLTAINYGHQYFALGANAVLELANLPKQREQLLKRFADIKSGQDAELTRATK